MKPLLNERIAQFDSPFRRLDELIAGIPPDPARKPIIMSVGEPQDSPPALLAAGAAACASIGAAGAAASPSHPTRRAELVFTPGM